MGKKKDAWDYQPAILSSLTSKIMISFWNTSRHMDDREVIRNIQHDALHKGQIVPD